MKTIIYSSNYVEVNYHDKGNYIVFNWNDFAIPLETLKTAHREALDFAKKHKVTTYIANTANVKNVLKPECIEWWGQWMPMISLSGIRKIITIMPVDPLQKGCTKNWQKEVVGKITLQNVASLSEAILAI